MSNIVDIQDSGFYRKYLNSLHRFMHILSSILFSVQTLHFTLEVIKNTRLQKQCYNVHKPTIFFRNFHHVREFGLNIWLPFSIICTAACRVLPTSLGPRFLILHRSSANPPLATVMLRRPVSKKVGRTCLL